MGSGGVGGFFGAVLARSGKEVWFVARGSHLGGMKSGGLRIRSSVGDWTVPSGRMTDDPSDAGSTDLVLFCVKSYDTEKAARQLAPILSSNSVVISLQNGIDNEEILHRILPKCPVFAGAAYISARITAPAEITETGGFQRIAFGPLFEPIDKRATELHAMFAEAKIKADLREDMRSELWRKFAFITSVGSLTALTRLNHREMLASPETMDLVFAAMKETEQVARAQGIPFEPLNPDKIIEGMKRFDGETRSSMYYDLINQRPLEIESLNGTIVRLGKEAGVPTPIHQTIYASLLPHHRLHSAHRS
jgi:2-dehydropantoate 2-reductase